MLQQDSNKLNTVITFNSRTENSADSVHARDKFIELLFV